MKKKTYIIIASTIANTDARVTASNTRKLKAIA